MTKQIIVTWEGPFIAKKVIDEYNLDIAERFDCGLYQIYGPYKLYSNKKRLGRNVLLYIGHTLLGSFSARIASQGFCKDSEHHVYLGRIEGYDYDIISWECDVRDAEMLLINNYAPPYNAQYVDDLHRAWLNNKDCEIINNGNKADLDETIKSNDIVHY